MTQRTHGVQIHALIESTDGISRRKGHPMTVRDVLNKHILCSRFLSLSGVITIIGSLGAMNTVRPSVAVSHDPYFLALAGLMVMGAGLIVIGQIRLFGVRCPSCQGKLGFLVRRKQNLDHINFCPVCGRSLDDTATDGKSMTARAKKERPWSDELV
jgi:hypothetical protein